MLLRPPVCGTLLCKFKQTKALFEVNISHTWLCFKINLEFPPQQYQCSGHYPRAVQAGDAVDFKASQEILTQFGGENHWFILSSQKNSHLVPFRKGKQILHSLSGLFELITQAEQDIPRGSIMAQPGP